MGKTFKDAPYIIQRARRNGRKAPRNWRAFSKWNSEESRQIRERLRKEGFSHYEISDIMDKFEDDLLGPVDEGKPWWKMFGQPAALKDYVKSENRAKRAKVRQKMKHGEYDDIDNRGTERNSAKWYL